MTVVHYALHGLRLASQIALPDAPPTDAGPADVEITVGDPRTVGVDPPTGELILDHHREGRRQYAASRTADRVRFRVPGHADFDVDPDLDRIVCIPDPRADRELLALMLTGNVLSFLLSLAGHAVVHAGAVTVGDGAIAVVGPSGVGKSTLTAWLCASGAGLVTDDVLRVDPDGSCHRGGWEIRLRDRAHAHADALARRGGVGRCTVDGRVAVRLPPSAPPRSRLRAIVVPRPLPGSAALRMHRMDATTAALTLVGMPRTSGWLVAGPDSAHFATLVDLAARVGVHVVDVPWGPPFDPKTPQRIFAELGVPAPGGDGSVRRR